MQVNKSQFRRLTERAERLRLQTEPVNCLKPEALIVDRGGHGAQVVIRDNVGSLRSVAAPPA
jgi:hypothetical protein